MTKKANEEQIKQTVEDDYFLLQLIQCLVERLGGEVTINDAEILEVCDGERGLKMNLNLNEDNEEDEGSLTLTSGYFEDEENVDSL